MRAGDRVVTSAAHRRESADTEWMVIGEIAGPFGVRGEAKVVSLTDFPQRFEGLEQVFLGPQRKQYAVERLRKHGGRWLLKFVGLDTPEQVAALGHLDISVPRTEAFPLPPGSYYLDELIGVIVRTPECEIGPIVEVFRTGSNDVWAIKRDEGTVLVPAIADAVVELNLVQGYAVVLPWVFESEN